MIKAVTKYALEAREFVREEARRNGVNSCRVDDTLEQISLQKKELLFVCKYAPAGTDFIFLMETVAETWEFHEDGSPSVLDYNLFEDLREAGWSAHD
jgi:hypothetical protein